MNILIADDDPLVRQVLRKLIEREIPSRIEDVDDGAYAWRKLNSGFIPDVCLFDIYMDGFDGLSLARMMQVDSRLKKIPIIIITGSREEEHRSEAARIGTLAFLHKPFSGKDILAAVSEVSANITNEISENLETLASENFVRDTLKLELKHYWFQVGETIKKTDSLLATARKNLIDYKVPDARHRLMEIRDMCMKLRLERVAEAAIKIVLLFSGEKTDCDITTLEQELSRLKINHSKLGKALGDQINDL